MANGNAKVGSKAVANHSWSSGEYRELERIVKGFANHRRLRVLTLLEGDPDLSIDKIAERLNMGYMNASDHLRRMTLAGLVAKHGREGIMLHRLTPRAGMILAFCKKLKRGE